MMVVLWMVLTLSHFSNEILAEGPDPDPNPKSMAEILDRELDKLKKNLGTEMGKEESKPPLIDPDTVPRELIFEKTVIPYAAPSSQPDERAGENVEELVFPGPSPSPRASPPKKR